MIRNWDEFNRKLKQVALIDVSVAEHTRVRDLALVNAQAEFDRSTKPALAVRATIAKELEQFYRKHRKEVEETGKRSIDLTFGRAGFRARAATLRLMKGFKWPDVIAAIKARCLSSAADQYIRTKETVKKEELKKAGLDAGTLEQLHVTVKGGEEFFFETFPEKAVNEAA
jgi:phage host-nuclease inhibitor protein Gam